MDNLTYFIIGGGILLAIIVIIITIIIVKNIKNFDQRVCFAEIITNHDKSIFIKDLEKAIEKAQKSKLVVDVSYTTEISQMGITHNALVIGRIQKNKK